MKRSLARSVIVLFLAGLLMLLLVPAVAAASPQDPSALFTTTTRDGVTLALKRYLPDAGAQLHTGAQPVICMPGLCCNLNFFDVRTPAGERYNFPLPADLAAWARNDPYVAVDHLKYYSMAYYLYDQGYDVWCANYRGEGRAPFRSGGQDGYAIDELGVYDLQAIITRVFDLTGRHPVWVGHSMGSTMAYEYLQGCKYGSGWNPHVVSDPALAAERNGGSGREALKGFVDLDGPMIAVGNALPDTRLLWAPLSVPLYLNLRPVTRTLGNIAGPVFQGVEYLMWWIWDALGIQNAGMLNSLLSMNPANMNVDVTRYMLKYGVDGMSTRTLAQYGDGAANGKFREDYKNGKWNSLIVKPRNPRAGDGYYYYSDNLARINLPSLVIADATEDITSPSDIQDFYEGKTRNALDEFYIAAGTAHLDVVMGLNAPTTTFVKIGEWMGKLCQN
ncbi:MAG: alpha/beta hydrolase [Candidatus Geothermincolia bacterium]